MAIQTRAAGRLAKGGQAGELTHIPKTAQPAVAALVRSIFSQPDADSVRAQHQAVIDQLEPRFAEAAALLEQAT